MIRAYPRLEVLQAFSEIGEFRRGNENNIKLLGHCAREFKILYHVRYFRTYEGSGKLTSSLSRISAKVRYMRSVFRLIQSCRIIKLPRLSSNRLSVLKSSSKLITKSLKYPSSELDEICASSWRSYLMTLKQGQIILPSPCMRLR